MIKLHKYIYLVIIYWLYYYYDDSQILRESHFQNLSIFLTVEQIILLTVYE